MTIQHFDVGPLRFPAKVEGPEDGSVVFLLHGWPQTTACWRDVTAVLAAAGHRVGSVVIDDAREVIGVNDRSQLATAEAELRRRINHRWMRHGVTMVDPERTYVESAVQLAPDVTLFPGTVLGGHTVVAEGAEIGPDTRLVDCVVGAHSLVVHSVGTGAEIGSGARVGPFAALAPGAAVAAGAVTPPFYTARGR